MYMNTSLSYLGLYALQWLHPFHFHSNLGSKIRNAVVQNIKITKILLLRNIKINKISLVEILRFVQCC